MAGDLETSPPWLSAASWPGKVVYFLSLVIAAMAGHFLTPLISSDTFKSIVIQFPSPRLRHDSIARSTHNIVKDSWKTPYMQEYSYSVKDSPACVGLLPEEAYLGVNDTQPIRSLEDLTRPGLRTLLFFPRFGLGNALRGFCSSYVYAMLSGRRIVRIHGGPHKQVMNTLCEAFNCSYDMISWDGPNDKAFGDVMRMAPWQIPATQSNWPLYRSLFEKSPSGWVNTGAYYDGFWNRNVTVRACVMQALDCATEWCVRSRAMNALLGRGPAEALGPVIAEMLHTGGEDRDAPVELEEGAGLRLQFDVAVHMRTRTTAVENRVGLKVCGPEDSKCMEAAKVRLKQEEKLMSAYLMPVKWACVGALLKNVSRLKAPAQGGNASLSIFLATDNELLRPRFVNFLKPYGPVYYSAGHVVHTSKGGSSSKLPTMAEFYLLSKASHVIEVDNYISTFCLFAALFGNGTLVAHVGRPQQCAFPALHKAPSSATRT
eukprot:jgi/Mesen1/7747/ME000407S06970